MKTLHARGEFSLRRTEPTWNAIFKSDLCFLAMDRRLSSKTFTIVPGGDTIRVELGRGDGSELTRRKAGEKAPFRFTYVGPRADLGLGWTQAADAPDRTSTLATCLRTVHAGQM